MSGLGQQISRRFGFTLLGLWVAITLNFFIPRMMPGDPATVMFARLQGKLKPEALDALKESLGYSDASLWQQYLQYLSSLAKGDLGVSLIKQSPVVDLVAESLLWSIFLAGGALVASFMIGTLLGIYSAWNRGGLFDSAFPPVLAFIGAFPYFFLAMVALYFLGFELGWFPIRHAYESGLSPGLNGDFIYSVWIHAVLPGGTMVIVSLGGWMLSMRNNMLTVLGEDYLSFARARGLNDRWIMLRYAARNAILPNLTGFGMALGFVVSGAMFTEIVFAYPGQGYLLLQAVQSQDYLLMQGVFLTISMAALGANFIVDVLTLSLDPRSRESG